MPDRSSKKPGRDFAQIAKHVVDVATGNAPPEPPAPEKNAAAVELGRLGGLKGGKARAKAMTKKERTSVARLAARARWRKHAGKP